MTVEGKLSKLKEIISELKSVVVAFSGGVDSTLVTKVCYDILKDNSMAVTARSETYPDFEFKEAQIL
ncbi:MAG: TIGR00268 family protein, partial [Candidatus Scalindua sp.]|nr:TIGR00268 family protein [Candidatus Scalindua sp.]